MKPGGLARITVPIPTLFESIGDESTKIMRRDDIVLLLKREPKAWYWPCWQVLYDGQTGIIADRWLQGIEMNDASYLGENEDSDDE